MAEAPDPPPLYPLSETRRDGTRPSVRLGLRIFANLWEFIAAQITGEGSADVDRPETQLDKIVPCSIFI